jgi:hypothetical protein
MIYSERVYKVVHRWNEESDRWMYIEYNQQGKIVGLNYMQGDEYQLFKKHWCVSDMGLTEFYQQQKYTFPIEFKAVDSLSFVNSCMWAYHSAVSLYENYLKK